MIRIPKNGTNGLPMTFYHVTSDTDDKVITRHEFFQLLRSTPNGDKHVVPDYDAGIVYFIDCGEHIADISRAFCREADAQRKRYVRQHECALRGTPQCDGWTDEPDREHSCDACTNKNTCRTISLNDIIEDDEGKQFEFGNTLADDLSDTVEEIVLRNFDRDLLRTALECLNEDDRKYILTRYGDDMDFIKLAEIYGTNRHYASKRAGRIEERLRKIIDKM